MQSFSIGLFTDNSNLTIISFTQSCVGQSVEPRPILTCEQLSLSSWCYHLLSTNHETSPEDVFSTSSRTFHWSQNKSFLDVLSTFDIDVQVTSLHTFFETSEELLLLKFFMTPTFTSCRKNYRAHSTSAAAWGVNFTWRATCQLWPLTLEYKRPDEGLMTRSGYIIKLMNSHMAWTLKGCKITFDSGSTGRLFNIGNDVKNWHQLHNKQIFTKIFELNEAKTSNMLLTLISTLMEQTWYMSKTAINTQYINIILNFHWVTFVNHHQSWW